MIQSTSYIWVEWTTLITYNTKEPVILMHMKCFISIFNLGLMFDHSSHLLQHGKIVVAKITSFGETWASYKDEHKNVGILTYNNVPN